MQELSPPWADSEQVSDITSDIKGVAVQRGCYCTGTTINIFTYAGWQEVCKSVSTLVSVTSLEERASFVGVVLLVLHTCECHASFVH